MSTNNFKAQRSWPKHLVSQPKQKAAKADADLYMQCFLAKSFKETVSVLKIFNFMYSKTYKYPQGQNKIVLQSAFLSRILFVIFVPRNHHLTRKMQISSQTIDLTCLHSLRISIYSSVGTNVRTKCVQASSPSSPCLPYCLS